MKTVRLLVCIIVAMVIAGCDGSKSSTTQDTQGLTVPNLGSYTVIATMNEGDNPPKVVSWYDKAELVCVESGYVRPFRNQSAAFTCWAVNEAPAPFRKLVEQHNQPPQSGVPF